MSRLRLLTALLWEHAHQYLAGTVLLAVTLWMTLSIPGYLQEAIDLLRADPDPSGEAFLNRIGLVLAFAVAIIFTRTSSRLLFFVPGRRVEYDLKNRLLAHISRLQRGFFLENPTGAIISRINNDINGVRMMLGFGLMQLFNSLFTLSLAPYYMYLISPRLTLYCALPIVAAGGLLQWAVVRLRREQIRQMKGLQDLSDFTVETYNGIDILKTYRVAAWAERTFDGLNTEVRDCSIRMATIRAFLMPVLIHVVNGLKVMLVLVGGVMVISADMSIGQFMAYALYLSLMVWPLMGMTFTLFVLQRGMTGLASLEEIFRMQPDVPPPLPGADEALADPLREGLRVEGLSYAFPDAPETLVLQDVSFAVRPGEVVGLFGPIGSGKTTLVNLVNRYLNPPPGTVFLDGVDITHLTQQRLRRAVVTVTQEPFLFSDTVSENIRFAAGQDGDEALGAAVEAAALTDDLARMPDGLATLVGEKGITLSGGQKQRIALARSILKPCDLLVLDDVLSAVDHGTERFLVESIYGFRHARALLIVSHRVSALERANRIVVLDEGRVAAVGTHAELIARPGAYREAFLYQTEQAAREGLPGPAAPGRVSEAAP